MKTNSIFSKSFLSTLLFMAVSAISFDGFAQCNPVVSKSIFNSVNFTGSSAASVWNNAANLLTGSNPQQVCVNTCTTGNCNEYVVAVNISSCSFINPTRVFEKIGGVVLIGGLFTNSNLPGLVFQKFASTTNVFCKGRINFKLTTPVLNPGDPCAPCLSPFGQVTFSATFDIFKNITTYPTIVFPPCIGVNERFALTIDPRLQCAADGIGVDDITINDNGLRNIYTGVTLEYNSSDRTSFTYKTGTNDFPACSTGSGPSCVPFGPPNQVTFPLNVTASVGRCSNFSPGLVQIYRRARNTYITSQTFLGVDKCGTSLHEVLPGGQNNATSIPVCTTTNCTSNFILISQGNRGVSGINYTWTAPAGYEILNPATNLPITNPTTLSDVRVRNIAGQQNSGVFNVIENSSGGGCNSVAANFYVFRTLVSGHNQVNITPQKDCYKPNETFTANLTNAPGQTRFRWSVPTNWEITGGVGQNLVISNGSTVIEGDNLIQITVRALNGASTGRVTVKNIISPELRAVGSNSTCEVEVQNGADIKASDELGLSHNFTYNPGTSPRRIQTSLTTTSLGILGTNCDEFGLNYNYTFAGRVYNCDPTQPGCTTAIYTTPSSGNSFVCNTNIFNTNAVCSSPNGRIFAPLITGRWYVGTFRIIVETNNSGCNQLNCFYSERTIVCNTPSTSIQGRTAVDNPPIFGGEDIDEQRLGIFPNPLESDKAKVYVPKGRGGQFNIMDASGKTIKQVQLIEGLSVVDFSDLKPGLFRLQSTGGTHRLFVSFIK